MHALCILHNDSLQPLTLLLLDIHRLHITVQLLLRALLVVTFPRDTHAQSVGDTLDAGFPDFLVQLRVEADVFCALWVEQWVSIVMRVVW